MSEDLGNRKVLTVLMHPPLLLEIYLFPTFEDLIYLRQSLVWGPQLRTGTVGTSHSYCENIVQSADPYECAAFGSITDTSAKIYIRVSHDDCFC